MPLYEYECRDCGKRFEELAADQDEKIACPECKSPNTRTLLSLFATACNPAANPAAHCGRQAGSHFT